MLYTLSPRSKQHATAKAKRRRGERAQEDERDEEALSRRRRDPQVAQRQGAVSPTDPRLFNALIPPPPARMMRSFDFDARVAYAPLALSLPNHTAIYHEWPPKRLRKELPSYISTAVVVDTDQPDGSVMGEDDGAGLDLPRLVGPPIHVQAGDTLSVHVTNSLPTTGLSIHWHGFEMEHALEYDGVVGVTQCPISPYETFKYEFVVEETPGTYWWHTHSGTLGLHAVNSLHGPLIVHPAGEEKKVLVDGLNSADGSISCTDIMSCVHTPWYYENERVLFFKDGFVHPEALQFAWKVGGLNEAVSKDDSGNTVGTSAWEFGTCNGRMREVVPVSAGETYKFRIINGGAHYGLRINIANLRLTVIAADSEPVEPLVVDEVFVHAAERFDVEVTIPDDWRDGDTFWIRADTAESSVRGYQNGVRAILRVADLHSHAPLANEVLDPPDDIRSSAERDEDHLTINCFERKTFDGVPYSGRCLPITALSRFSTLPTKRELEGSSGSEEVHFIDSHFQPNPQHSHFIRLDDGPWYQHVNPKKSMLDPSFTAEDLHANTAVLNVPAFSYVVLVWRTTSLMDHPMHLHGLKMELLDMVTPDKQADCTLAKCRLNTRYQSPDDVRVLSASIPPNEAVLKDTFIVPAGGAVVTRIHTGGPSLWYSHCHLEMHHFDGMAFILNVGNYSASSSARDLSDMPSCSIAFVQTQREHPACDCYENPNAVLSTYLTSDYKCSRDYLCQHVNSRAANLDSYPYPGVDTIHSDYFMPGWAISFICLAAFVCMLLLARHAISWRRSYDTKAADERTCDATASGKLGGKPPLGRRGTMCTSISTGTDQMPEDTTQSKSALASSMTLDRAGDPDSAEKSGVATQRCRMSWSSDICYKEDIEEEEKKSESSLAVHTTEPVVQAKMEHEETELDATRHGTSQRPTATQTDPFLVQLKETMFAQYKIYRPLCVNNLRVFEVCSLGLLTGFLFYNVGLERSFVGLSQRLSLFFFSTTLWTFTRMYPSVGFSYQWSLLYQVDFKKRKYSVGPVVLGRLLVVLGLESFWPLIYAFLCYPFASVFGSIKVVMLVGLFLILNNLCYISLGAALGVYCKRVPLGMIQSTIFSQTSLVAAGFYTKLPPALAWIRYLSPFFWSFRGILKSCFKWNDTVECLKGSSEVGATQCYLEYHPAIDTYKERGINVAMSNDPSSATVYLEYLALVLLLLFMNALIYLRASIVNRRFEQQSSGLANMSRGEEGRPEVLPRRRGSVTSVILSRFDSSENVDESGSKEANGEAQKKRRMSRRDSLREQVMSKIQSSNAFTWK